MYSNEAERADQVIYDDFKLNKPFGLHGLYRNISLLWRLIYYTLCFQLLFILWSELQHVYIPLTK